MDDQPPAPPLPGAPPPGPASSGEIVVADDDIPFMPPLPLTKFDASDFAKSQRRRQAWRDRILAASDRTKARIEQAHALRLEGDEKDPPKFAAPVPVTGGTGHLRGIYRAAIDELFATADPDGPDAGAVARIAAADCVLVLWEIATHRGIRPSLRRRAAGDLLKYERSCAATTTPLPAGQNADGALARPPAELNDAELTIALRDAVIKLAVRG